MWQHGTFYWNELMTRDVAAAKDFYAKSLGWTYEDMPMADGGTYTVIQGPEHPVGGIFEMSGPEFEGVPEHWMAYIAVDDIDARVEKAKAAGATLHRPPFDVVEVGRIAMLQQPNGGMIGWMTPSMPGSGG